MDRFESLEFSSLPVTNSVISERRVAILEDRARRVSPNFFKRRYSCHLRSTAIMAIMDPFTRSHRNVQRTTYQQNPRILGSSPAVPK